eukprot:NODE_31947_length_386_cov_1.532819.p3 GENE.NODE_31947_length_386_cov_1.532819~~NODE_31947_length_386_cov_1.532819.p3  ORF type:complete len:59 (-),score=2.66 NODE_31947_length_386_cov_1.532819:4-180(-)
MSNPKQLQCMRKCEGSVSAPPVVNYMCVPSHTQLRIAQPFAAGMWSPDAILEIPCTLR